MVFEDIVSTTELIIAEPNILGVILFILIPGYFLAKNRPLINRYKFLYKKPSSKYDMESIFLRFVYFFINGVALAGISAIFAIVYGMLINFNYELRVFLALGFYFEYLILSIILIINFKTGSKIRNKKIKIISGLKSLLSVNFIKYFVIAISLILFTIMFSIWFSFLVYPEKFSVTPGALTLEKGQNFSDPIEFIIINKESKTNTIWSIESEKYEFILGPVKSPFVIYGNEAVKLNITLIPKEDVVSDKLTIRDGTGYTQDIPIKVV
jgi:hypothetical protein